MLPGDNREVLKFAALVLAASALWAAADPVVHDLDGRSVRPLDATSTVVVIFTRTDCPISNRYAPEVRRIHETFAPKGVVFWLAYVDPREPVAAIRDHMREYGYPFGALLDGHHELARATGATITPEAAVYHRGKLIYRGRIDDRYVSFGKARQSASVHDLADVLEQTVAGKPPEFREARAVGCFIEDLK